MPKASHGNSPGIILLRHTALSPGVSHSSRRVSAPIPSVARAAFKHPKTVFTIISVSVRKQRFFYLFLIAGNGCIFVI
jgi:hypothetical protein